MVREVRRRSIKKTPYRQHSQGQNASQVFDLKAYLNQILPHDNKKYVIFNVYINISTTEEEEAKGNLTIGSDFSMIR